MARQPFKFKNGAKTLYGIGHDCLAQRPHLAAIVGCCVSTWSQIELELSLCLAAMLRTSSEAAAAVFLSLQNARAQREALLSAAKVTLDPDDLSAFDVVMELHKSLSLERNNLVHGIFGFCNDEPDWLLWHASAKHAAWLTGVYRADATGDHPSDPHAKLKDEMFVYTKDDLDIILSDFSKLREICFYLHCYLKAKDPHSKVHERARLFALLQIQE